MGQVEGKKIQLGDMGHIVALSDVCDLVAGYAFKSRHFGDYPTKVIKIKDIQPPFVNFSSLQGVELSRYNREKLQKYLVGNGDYVLAMTGATIGKIGKICQGNAYINQRVLVFRPKEKICDKHFLYYVLNDKDFLPYIMNHIDSESAQPNISATTIGKYTFALPHMAEQIKIASLLSSLDAKIELNTQINHNLEEQAKAIFKSWFVDFEPFRDGEFVDSELGRIPQGWSCGTLKDLLEVRYGKDHKKLSDGNIPVYGSGGLMRYVEKSLYSGEAVLIPRKGTLNNVMHVSGDFWTVDTMFYSIPKKIGAGKYLYNILSELDLASMNSGSAVPSMTTDILNSIKIILPPDQILADFDYQTSALWQLREANTEQSKKLAGVRDSLLPKLMSGEIDVSEIEI